MWVLKRLGAVGLLAVALSACAPTGPHQCKLYISGVMPIINSSGSPIVRAGINGHPAALIIDTGAATSVIGSSYISPLGLEVMGPVGTMTGVGGSELVQAVMIKSLEMGPSSARNIVTIAGGKFGEKADGLPVVGLFGQEFLANYDTIVDMPDHVVQLVRTEDCAVATPGWEGTIHKIPVTHSANDGLKTRLQIKINGKSADAVLDTGASSSLVTMSVARRAGVTRAMLSNDPVFPGYGVTREPIKIYRHLFSTLEVGDIAFKNIRLDVVESLPGSEALLGSDFLKHYRLWISRDDYLYAQHDKDIPAGEADQSAARQP
ncbi:MULTISPECIES: retroviral-like aspartic protease family protein [unclassified Gluconobacter]|uniref:retroviral-like aspartic protease family protein n=1 Tax=unclassified Gluconobacter TaxID=2644261 RepID=UPI001C04A4A8|nr:retroviral-like aspartic protease family protein [Gluconobacter sp. P5H9_d]